MNHVQNIIQNSLGNDLHSEDYTSSSGDSITIISYKNGLEKGITAHSTLGVCLYQEPSLEQGENVAVELIGVEHEDSDIVRGILAYCAYAVMDGMPIQPFSCWSDLLPLYIPESKLKHVLFLPAYLWGDKLLMSKSKNITVLYLLVCPLSDGEADFLYKHHDNSVGAEKLIEDIEKQEAYIFDFNREPIF